MTAYEPGDLAMATVRGVPDVLVVSDADFGGEPLWVTACVINGARCHPTTDVTDVRPMRAVPADAVVLDLSGFNPGAVAQSLRKWSADTHGALGRVLADQIEAQTAPPRPDEPTGLGAVVEDAEGQRWVRHNTTGGGSWYVDGVTRPYERVTAVRVMSQGWSE